MPACLAEMVAGPIKQFVDTANPDALNFTTSTGSVIRQTGFRRRIFKPAAEKAKLVPGVRPHDLRHTAVALAIQAEWHPKKIQDMLGHSSIEVTLGTYGHLFASLHSDGAVQMDAIYSEAAKKDDRSIPP